MTGPTCTQNTTRFGHDGTECANLASGAFLTDEQQGTGVVRHDESVSY
jgi:hypothetical protein